MKLSKMMAMLAVVAFLGLGLVGAADAGLSGKKELDNEKLVIKFYQEMDRGGYQVVDTETLKGWVDAKKPMLIVDTMPYESSYKKNHIPGAKQFEFPIPEKTEMSDAEKAKFIELLGADKDAVLVFYCGFPKCSRSHNGAMWAKKLGYKNVYRHPGGIVAWMEAGYPVAQAK